MVDTDNQGTSDMLRDMATAMIVSNAVEYGLKRVVQNGVDTVTIRMANSSVRKRISKNTLVKVVEAVKDRVKKIIKGITNKKVVQVLKDLTKKQGVKAGKAVGRSASTAGTVAASGCAGGPQGCAAGAAVGTAIFVWDCMNLIWDLMDTHGLTIVFNEEMIQGIGEGIKQSVNEAFAEYSDEPYLDTEIFFDPLSLIFVKEEGSDDLVISEEWGELYLKHVHHYMTKIKGHPENWEELMPPAPKIEEIPDTDLEYQYSQKTNVQTSKKSMAFIILLIVIGILSLVFIFM